MRDISSIYLFADSQLLFWIQDSELFLKSVLNHVSSPKPHAAYIGASNGKQEVFFEIFESAMEGIGIHNCRMIESNFPDQDNDFLEKSDIILLAGGDVVKGWDVIQSTGLKSAILKKYGEGSVLIGVSAGAVQLGLCANDSNTGDLSSIIDTFQIIPYIIGVHEEKEEWSNLKSLVLKKGDYSKGIGMPFGGGAIYYPDNSFEPVRKPIYEVFLDDGKPTYNLVCASTEDNSTPQVQ
ncbi:MAG: Type 1 glutamine amidotransferase-like domain-containing protein [Desulfobacteraceae bacterium]|jgi:peptidase E